MDARTDAGRLGRLVFLWGSLIVFMAVSAMIISLPINSGAGAVQLNVGDVSARDILAPQSLTYPSEVLTEQARERAASAVAPVYSAPDPRVARQQLVLLRDILEFINTVRADSLATRAQRQADLAAVREVALTSTTVSLLINFSDPQWSAVQAEAQSLLEQVMRTAVRADEVEDVRRAIPARVSIALSEAQAGVVGELVAGLVAPNSFFNAEATAEARQAARELAATVYTQILRGQVIVSRNRPVTAEAWEALDQLGLLEPQRRWQETVSSALAVVIVGVLLTLYLWRFNPGIGRRPRQILLLGLLFTGFLFAAKLMVPGHTLLPFLFPAAALSMLLSVFIGPQLALTTSVALAALVGYIGDNSLELTIYTAMGGIIAALTLGRAERVNQFFWAGVAAALANASILLVFRATDANLDTLGLAQLMGASVANGVVSASLTLVGFFILGGLFDITTSLQLLDLARPDHPLLQFILRAAPGTYQHSLQVANLAEQAAEQIGANPMLTRVGALYHDAGKAKHPHYFVENQLDGHNVHETLDPYTSADIIINHVRDGLEMARRHRLPARIRDCIAEHHGTLKTYYQYTRALKAAGDDPAQVDESKFVYPGPRPRSKETALLMLADGCEAKVRSDRPKTEADIDRIVKYVIDDRLAKGQLDDTGLTLNDLRLIRESFVTTLKGLFHARLQYPEEKPPLPPPEAP
jgi:hypothetical protein